LSIIPLQLRNFCPSRESLPTNILPVATQVRRSLQSLIAADFQSVLKSFRGSRDTEFDRFCHNHVISLTLLVDTTRIVFGRFPPKDDQDEQSFLLKSILTTNYFTRRSCS
jgi:hypothetical protein